MAYMDGPMMGDFDDMRHEGQSNTLDVHMDPETGETVCCCPSRPEAGEVRDEDPQLAVELLKQKLAALDTQTSDGRTPMILGRR